jgi:nucleoside-diphosphate-sugar epimerase
MSIAIIGGTGFLGPRIAARLVARGIEPLVIARGRHPVALPDGARFAAADRMDRAAIAGLLRAHGATAAIDIFALSLRNSQPVLDAAEDAGARYLLISSTDVYRNYEGLLKKGMPPVRLEPATEDSPLRAMRYPYRSNARRPQGVEDDLFEDYDKIPIEEAALAGGRPSTVLRLPMIFGPGDKQHRFAWAIAAVESGPRVALDSRAAAWPNSYAYVDDVAEAVALAATLPAAAARIYNVAQPFVRTPVEWLERFAAVLGRPVDIALVAPDAGGLLHERADASDLSYPLTLDSTRIRADLGYAEVVPEDEALAATIAAERAAA